MQQYKITTLNTVEDTVDDCLLDANDPVHQLKSLQYLAGLGHSARLHEYRVTQGSNVSVTGNETQQLERQHSIQPGTPEWFQLWFSLPYLTGEKKIGK